MLRTWLWGVVGACMLASVVMAKPGIVRTRDGHTIEGEVDDRGDTVVIEKRGIRTTVDRPDVQSIEYPQSLDEQFGQQYAKLQPRDVKGRVALARWAFERRRYDLARSVLEEARQIDPNNREAADLAETVRVQMRLETAAHGEAGMPVEPGAEATAPAAPEASEGVAVAAPIERTYLTPADINRIRQMELRPQDAVRVRFDSDVQRRYVEANDLDPAEFAQLPLRERAEAILAGGDAGMRSDVKIMEDPPSIREYRISVQRTILSGCATAACHGGTGVVAGLALDPNTAGGDAPVYTNFYILQQYRKQVGDPAQIGVFGGASEGGSMYRMIDRTQPERSLLLQYGLPAHLADVRHPDVPGYKPTFSSPTDPRYRQVLRWIERSLNPVTPAYGIEFAIPGAPEASQTAANTDTEPLSPPTSQPVPEPAPATPVTPATPAASEPAPAVSEPAPAVPEPGN